MDKAVMALYAKGMTTRDIQATIKELYNVDISATLVAEIAGAMEDDARKWYKQRTEIFDFV